MMRKAFNLIELVVVVVVIAVIVVIAAAVLGSKGGAGKVPALTGPVNDYANVLSDQQEQELTQKLLDQERKTTNQIVILSVKSLDGRDPQEYATEVFNTWKLGKADKDNGVLILHSTGDRQIWIEVGIGLEAKLTDATAGQIYRQEIVPHFKKNDFFGGYVAGVDAINLAVAGQFRAQPGFATGPPTGGGSGSASGWPVWVWVLIIIVVLLIIVAIAANADPGGGGGYSGSSGSGGGWSSGGSSGGYSGGGGSSGGGGAGGGY